jgi:uncharacterized protein YgiB involved in biofilm formation
MRRRKSSLSITLVLIGTSALSSCGNDPEQNTRVMRRDIYNSLEDCRADWERADDCEVNKSALNQSGTQGSGIGPFLGPRYYWSDPSGRYDTNMLRPGSRATGVTNLGGPSANRLLPGRHSSISRGGFGSSSSVHSGASAS